MSEDFDWCAARSRWRDRQEAGRAAQRLAAKKGARIRAFRCADCGLWHIGEQGKAAGSIKRARRAWEG